MTPVEKVHETEQTQHHAELRQVLGQDVGGRLNERRQQAHGAHQHRQTLCRADPTKQRAGCEDGADLQQQLHRKEGAGGTVGGASRHEKQRVARGSNLRL